MTPDRTARRFVFQMPRFHTNLFYAVRALVEAGHDVKLICEHEDGIEDHSVVTPYYIDKDIPFSEVVTRLREFKPDALFLRDNSHLTRRFFRAATRLGRRVFAYNQHPLHLRRPAVKALIGPLRGRPLRRITPVPGLDRTGPPDRWAHYLPFPVDRPLSGPRDYAPGNCVRILCVAKLAQPRKNQRLLIEALKSLKGVGAFSLTLVGSSRSSVNRGSNDYRDALYREAETGELAGRMTIRADVPFADMRDIYLTHDICVLPSVNEPLGSAPIEAMAFGCVPIISSACGSAGYLAGTGVGRVVAAGDRAALADALKPFVERPETLAEQGRRAIELAGEEFGDARFVARMEDLVSASRD